MLFLKKMKIELGLLFQTHCIMSVVITLMQSNGNSNNVIEW